MSAALTLASLGHRDRLLPLVAAFHAEAGIETSEVQRADGITPLLEGSPHGAAYLIGPARAPIGYIVVSFGWSLEFGGMDGFIDELFIRPGVRERFAWDLQTFYTAARCIDRWFPAAKRLMLVQSVDMLAESARLEMELRLEAAAFSEMSENTKDDPGFRLPAIDWQRTGRDCVTMEWVDGIKMNNHAALV